jgi:hypothetical protein
VLGIVRKWFSEADCREAISAHRKQIPIRAASVLNGEDAFARPFCVQEETIMRRGGGRRAGDGTHRLDRTRVACGNAL